VIPPSVFIAIAEKRGLIGALTSDLIRAACTAAREWQGDFRLAFNISPLQFQDGSMPGLLEDAVREGGFPLARTQIEITETAVINDLASARRNIELLRAKGVRILLDDFGTGHSSLTRLQALPFDKIKIDASFVGSMDESRDSRKIVGAVIGLSQSLGLPVVAEGIEREAQAVMLRRLGCDFGQGWLFSRAVAPQEVPALLRARGAKQYQPILRDLSTNQRLAQLEAVYDAAPVGLCFVDRNGRILNVNRRYAEMIGIDLRTLIGRTIGEVDPRAVGYISAALERAMRGDPIPPRVWPRPVDGRTGLLTAAPAVDESGELIGLSLAVVDLPDKA